MKMKMMQIAEKTLKVWVGPELYLIGLRYHGHTEWWLNRDAWTGVYLKEGPVAQNIASIADAGIDEQTIMDAAEKLLMDGETLELNSDGELHIMRA